MKPFKGRAKGLEIIRKADIPRRVEGAVRASQEEVVVSRWGVLKHGKQDVEHRKPGEGAVDVALTGAALWIEKKLRRCFQARSAAASLPTVFYAVGLGHVPGIYTSWQEARPHTLGVHSDVKRFSSLKKAEEYMAKPTGPGDPLIRRPHLFTVGSALPNGPPGWGVHITFPGSPETQALWGPVLTSTARPS